MTRSYGWYASRTRGTRRRQAAVGASETEVSVATVELADWSLRAARYRGAELLRRIVEVDPLACPRCRGPMRILPVMTDPAVIARILAHRARALERLGCPVPQDAGAGRVRKARAGTPSPPRAGYRPILEPETLPVTTQRRGVGSEGRSKSLFQH